MNDSQKQRLERYVDIYLSDIDSLTHTAGWHGESPLAKMEIYQGDIPQYSGNDQSNVTMINEIAFIKEPHAKLKFIQQALIKLSKIDEDQAAAILISRYYQGCYLDSASKTVKVYKDTTRAQIAGMSPKRYKRKLTESYETLFEIVEIMEIGWKLAA